MHDRSGAMAALLAAVGEPRRADLAALDAAIRQAGPRLASGVEGGIIGYGRYRYRYASGREGDAPCVAIAARKAGISVYVGATPVERWADRLPGANCGKGCIRLRHAADMDPAVLAEIVEHARRIDGRLLDWTGLEHGAEPRIS